MENKADFSSLNLNQGLLEDFVACPRRFQLKIIDKLCWPAAFTDQIDNFDQSINRGNRFHLLCHQYFSGMDSSVLMQTISDPLLMKMFQTFIPYGEFLVGHRLFTEQLLSCSFKQFKFIAKYDLIVELEPSNFLIIDWKTSPNKPPREILSTRVQTILYPFIFHNASQIITGGSKIEAESIQMQYWYPLHPEPEENFPYSNQIHQKSQDDLSSLIEELSHFIQAEDVFPLTDDIKSCNYCNFRSLCNRGVSPGDLTNYVPIEQEDLSDFRFDLEEISEIAF